MGFNKEQALASIFIIAMFLIGFFVKDRILNEGKANNDKYNNGLKDSSVIFKKHKDAKWIWVTIKGAVRKPGKYKIKKGSRYFELISLAGGLSKKADTSRVKKNYFLVDGYSFYIPYKRYKRYKKFSNRLIKKKNQHNNRTWIEVEVRGAVKKPGVYQFKSGSKFRHLLKKAGGFKADAYRKKSYKNYYLRDGQSYFIRYK